ncbi:heterocyst development glycosyltransferase HepC [Brunnivagina elsteri]|uniref:Sugar transferase n=1 Tax=Brunnivagina elsteri CCALA 953 TaxID=987040 RepID=A0A2A2TEU6_9CYAN|nr:heterocyst development glycosyltransferase HepC [Calothrix elsteri]PAX52280.1 sugar transferase [Calothrix elsteri CCALA 953]
MTSSIIPNLQNYHTPTQEEENRSSYCTLKWRRGQLLVQPLGQNKQPYLSSLDTHESLVECLKHSSVNLVRIDPRLGETKLKLWADACEEAQKPLFLTIPTVHNGSKNNTNLPKWLKLVLNWIVALILLVTASPFVLGLVAIIQISSSESLLSREWHVGERGRLFRAIKFRTASVGIGTASGFEKMNGSYSNAIASWMGKYGLDNLPLLLNVLRGEISLTGRYSCKLEDVVRLSTEAQKQLNQIPGIADSWQVQSERDIVHHLDRQIL